MEKETFLDLAKNYASLTFEEALAIDELQQDFPYCQVIHSLATRGARDHKLETSQELLALSAVYATDRAVLKSIMMAPRAKRNQAAGTQLLPAEITNAEEATPQSDFQGSTLSGDALNLEIMNNLDRLQQLKQDFEASFQEFTRSGKPGIARPAAVSRPVTPAAPAPQKKEPPARIQGKPKTTDQLIPEPSGDFLLQQIASSRKRVPPETEKQKEQIDIIDQFISKQPSISRTPPASSEVQDLAEKGGDLIDSMVSETLVEILLRQGKKDKAIEVLRKLIWKFPQKKSIFAAQIDELKK